MNSYNTVLFSFSYIFIYLDHNESARTLYREMIPELLAGSSVFMDRNIDFDFSDILPGYLTAGALNRHKNLEI